MGILPALRSVTGEWALIGRTLSAVAELQRVATWMFADVDLHAFRDHVALTTLTIKDAPYLESLSGLGNLPDLAALTIVKAPRLHVIDEVAELSASLRELKFEECARIDAIDDLESLIGLRFLGISESGDIASLAPIESLTQLEAFYAWGSTCIVDGEPVALGGAAASEGDPHAQPPRLPPAGRRSHGWVLRLSAQSSPPRGCDEIRAHPSAASLHADYWRSLDDEEEFPLGAWLRRRGFQCDVSQPSARPGSSASNWTSRP